MKLSVILWASLGYIAVATALGLAGVVSGRPRWLEPGNFFTVFLGISIVAAAILVIGALIMLSRRQDQRDALFFDSALELADARLRSFALENRGAYVRGAKTWKSFSGGWGRSARGESESSITGRGSAVKLERNGWSVEVSSSVELIDRKFALVPYVVIRSLAAGSSGSRGGTENAPAGSAIWRWEASGKPVKPPANLSSRASSAGISLAEVSCKIELWQRALAVSANLSAPASGASDPTGASTVDESGELARDGFDVSRIGEFLRRAEAFFKESAI